LVDSQHGFQKGRSCLTNLLSFLEQLTGSIDVGDDVKVIFLDFVKVQNHRLLRKLSIHGIHGELFAWIEAWLKERNQRVCINDGYSGRRAINSVVPQGSVLGPIQFSS
jgi:ribonucleases P/MRP protein subunit RPP40